MKTFPRLRPAGAASVRAASLALLVLGLAGLPGCASSSRSPGDRLVVPLPMPQVETTMLGGGLRLSMLVERVCADAACTGRGYYLGVTNTTGRDVYIQYAPVKLIVGGRTLSWLEDARDETENHPAVGVFVRVPVSEEVMRLLQIAPGAVLMLGSTRFELTRTHLQRITALVPPAE